MKIKISDKQNLLSKKRGIGSYQQMLKEAISRYGEKNNLQLVDKEADVELITDFNFFLKNTCFSSKPTVVIIHDIIPLKYPRYFPAGLKGWFNWQLNLNKIKKLRGIITDSVVVKKELVDKFKLNNKQIKVVYPAAKAIYEKPPLVPVPSFSSKIPKSFFLYNGDVTWNKNLPRLAKAIKKTKFTLVLTGAALINRKNLSHPWHKSFVSFLKEVDDNPNFIFLGYVKDSELIWLYQKAKAVVLPSIEEGFGLPWLEASLLGTPVIISKTAVTEEITKGVSYFVNPLEVSSLAEALEKAFSNKETRLIVKQQNQAYFYSQKRFVVSLKTALQNLLGFKNNA